MMKTASKGRFSGVVRTLVAIGLASVAFSAVAADSVRLSVYGPGGPAPAMKEAAKVFSETRGVAVDVMAGPPAKWLDDARDKADLIYSGAQHMMGSFAQALPGVIDLREADPLYLRPVAILVRPGNPRRIRGLEDLLRPGFKVLAVAGAGQVGLWEDTVGRTGRIEAVRAFRRNLVLPEAANSAVARQQWNEQKDIDAWLIWNIWQVSNPAIADVVPVEPRYRIYRDTSVVQTTKGKTVPQASEFVAFLKSPEGQKIFEKWGWETGEKRAGKKGGKRHGSHGKKHGESH